MPRYGLIVAAALLAAPAPAAAAVPQSPRECEVSPIAGGYCGDGGPVADARLRAPRDVSALPGGGVLIADGANFVIRKVQDGVVSTVAGLGVPGDAPPRRPTRVEDVELADPRGVAALPDGSFAIADAGLKAVLLVGADGVVRTLARMALPVDVIALGDGTLAVVDQAAGAVVRLGLDGSVETLATGLTKPVQVAVRPGSGPPLERGLLVSEASDVVLLGPRGARTIVAGRGAVFPQAATLRLDRVAGVAIGPGGSLLVADTDAVRMVSPDGSVRVVAGERQPASMPVLLRQAAGIAFGEGDVLFVADPGSDQIKRVVIGPEGDVAAQPSLAQTSGSRRGRSGQPLGARPRCGREHDGPSLEFRFFTHRRGLLVAAPRRARVKAYAYRTSAFTRPVELVRRTARGQLATLRFRKLNRKRAYYFEVWAAGKCFRTGARGR